MSDPHKNEPTPWRDEDVLYKLYHEERLSQADIADRLGCRHETVRRWLNKHDSIEPRTFSESLKNRFEQKGHPARKERCSYFMDNEGYMIASDSYKQVRIHRLIAVAEHGFSDVSENVVHHKRQIPWLNYAENLEVMSRSDHMSHHNALRD
jgi:transcriptional regulator with XRE-family HTH domain